MNVDYSKQSSPSKWVPSSYIRMDEIEFQLKPEPVEYRNWEALWGKAKAAFIAISRVAQQSFAKHHPCWRGFECSEPSEKCNRGVELDHSIVSECS